MVEEGVPRSWLGRDFYDVLGVSSTASDQEIQAGYRRIARHTHPGIARAADDDAFDEAPEVIRAAADVSSEALVPALVPRAPG